MNNAWRANEFPQHHYAIIILMRQVIFETHRRKTLTNTVVWTDADNRPSGLRWLPMSALAAGQELADPATFIRGRTIQIQNAGRTQTGHQPPLLPLNH